MTFGQVDIATVALGLVQVDADEMVRLLFRHHSSAGVPQAVECSKRLLQFWSLIIESMINVDRQEEARPGPTPASVVCMFRCERPILLPHCSRV